MDYTRKYKNRRRRRRRVSIDINKKYKENIPYKLKSSTNYGQVETTLLKNHDKVELSKGTFFFGDYSGEGSLTCYNHETGVYSVLRDYHTDSIKRILCFEDGGNFYVASSSLDSSIKLLNCESKMVWKLNCELATAWRPCYIRCIRSLLTGSYLGFRMWNVKKPKEENYWVELGDSCLSFQELEGGKVLVASGKRISRWNFEKMMAECSCTMSNPGEITHSPGHRLAAVNFSTVNTGSKELDLIDIKNMETVKKLGGNHTNNVGPILMLQNGDLVVGECSTGNSRGRGHMYSYDLRKLDKYKRKWKTRNESSYGNVMDLVEMGNRNSFGIANYSGTIQVYHSVTKKLLMVKELPWQAFGIGFIPARTDNMERQDAVERNEFMRDELLGYEVKLSNKNLDCSKIFLNSH